MVAQTQSDHGDLADGMDGIQREIATIAAECRQSASKLSDGMGGMQQEIATIAAECNQSASKLSVLQAQADQTSAELTQVGDKVVGELQGRFDVLEVQIAESVPSLDAKIRSTAEELLQAMDWKIDAGLAAVEQDEPHRSSDAALPIAVLERHEHALSSLEELAIDITTRLDAVAGRSPGGLASVEDSSYGGSGASMPAVAGLRDDVAQARAETAKASRRSKQAERSVGTVQEQLRGVTAQVTAVQSTVAAMRQQNDASIGMPLSLSLSLPLSLSLARALPPSLSSRAECHRASRKSAPALLRPRTFRFV